MEGAIRGRYRLGRSLGRGATGEVFLGADTGGRRYAVKVLHRNLASDPRVVGRFMREHLVLGLCHPNLVRVRDLVANGEELAIVMDMVSGASLRETLTATGTLRTADVARIVSGIAKALAVLHEAGIVHREVRPENVLLPTPAASGSTEPKLTDFAPWRLLSGSALGRTMFTAAPEYDAPELAGGWAEPSTASDMYALGVLLYELCCGVTPAAGGSPLALTGRHPGPRSGIPDPLPQLICALLAKRPQHRPRLANLVADILDATANSLRFAPEGTRGVLGREPVLPACKIQPFGQADNSAHRMVKSGSESLVP